ncbi:MAG: hypothetical protein ACHQEM_09550 [Chitinophagales bacterium]
MIYVPKNRASIQMFALNQAGHAMSTGSNVRTNGQGRQALQVAK